MQDFDCYITWGALVYRDIFPNGIIYHSVDSWISWNVTYFVMLLNASGLIYLHGQLKHLVTILNTRLFGEKWYQQMVRWGPIVNFLNKCVGSSCLHRLVWDYKALPTHTSHMLMLCSNDLHVYILYANIAVQYCLLISRENASKMFLLLLFGKTILVLLIPCRFVDQKLRETSQD